MLYLYRCTMCVWGGGGQNRGSENPKISFRKLRPLPKVSALTVENIFIGDVQIKNK